MLRRWDAAAAALLCLLLVVSGPAGARDGDSFTLTRGARVGVVDLLDPEIAHYHDARSLQDQFLKTYTVSWRIDVMLANALKDRLQQLGVVQVPVAPSAAIVDSREDCMVNANVARGLSRNCAALYAQLAAAQQLDALIVLAPGLNNSQHGRRRRELPEYLRGWGIATGVADAPEGKPSLFDMTELLLLGVDGNEVSVRAREWGGGYEEEWASVAPDPASLTPGQLDQLQPMFADMLSRQCGRLLDQVATGR